MASPEASAPDVDIAFLLNQTSYALSARLTESLAALGISLREYCVLAKAVDQEATQNAIAEQAALDKTTMVVTVDRLEAAGLAERRVSSSDRRARVITVTPRGRRTVARAHGVVGEVYDHLLGNLPTADRASFVAALELLAGGVLATPSHLMQPARRKAPRARSIAS